MIPHLHDEQNSTRIFLNFDNFKITIRAMFEVINEIFTFKKNI